MARSKKMSVYTREFILMLLDKQLERYGVTWEECEEIYKKTNVPSYYQYSFKTPEEFEEWKAFCIEQMKNSKERITKKRAEGAFAMFNASYGLIKKYKDA